MNRIELINEQKEMGLRVIFDGDNPINEEIYLLLEELDINRAGDVSKFLNNNGYGNLSVCPECHVDDFVHVETCSLNRFKNEQL
jgi:hypothetical protein